MPVVLESLTNLQLREFPELSVEAPADVSLERTQAQLKRIHRGRPRDGQPGAEPKPLE